MIGILKLPQNVRRKEQQLAVETVIEKYHDLVIDLFESLIHDHGTAHQTCESIFREIRSNWKKEGFRKFERPWVLKLCAEKILPVIVRESPYSPISKDLELGTKSTLEYRLEYFRVFFRRLKPQDQLLLFLFYRHGIPSSELSAVFSTPEGSIELKKQQALRTLTSWIFEDSKNEKEQISKVIVCLKKSSLGESVQLDKEAVSQGEQSVWKRSPWFLQLSAQSMGIVGMIVFMLVSVPKLRSMYESNLERRLDTYGLSDIADIEEELAPIAFVDDDFQELESNESELNRDPAQLVSEPAPAVAERPQDSNVEKPADGKIVVGNSEIWRFFVKTDSPEDFRRKVHETLVQMNFSENPEKAEGVVAPGGIQFDLLMPMDMVSPLRKEIEKAAQVSATGQIALPVKDTFRWYRKKSNRGIPSGHTRVIIWLSQI